MSRAGLRSALIACITDGAHNARTTVAVRRLREINHTAHAALDSDLAEHDAAPTGFYVLFLREVHDEVFAGRTTNEAERFAQLTREIHEADPMLPLTLLACISAGDRETFLVRTAHAGDVRSLRDRLQASYDSHGVAGFFQIGAVL